MNLTVITPPPVEPVTIERAFVELRLGMPGDDFADHPDYGAVVAKLAAARRHCEFLTGLAFVQQTLRLEATLDELNPSAWDRRRSATGNALRLLRGPVQSIVAVSCYDAYTELQTLDGDDYYITGGDMPQVRLMPGVSLPAMFGRDDALRIDYVAGFQPGPVPEDFDPVNDAPHYLADNVPAPIKEAILLTLRMLQWEMTEGERASTTAARDALLGGDKVLRVV